MPNRSVTCTHDDGSLEVSYSGPAPTAAMDVTGTIRQGGNEVVAVVEGQDEAYTDPLLGWHPLGGETLLTTAAPNGPSVTFVGTVALPEAPGQRRRLVLREY